MEAKLVVNNKMIDEVKTIVTSLRKLSNMITEQMLYNNTPDAAKQEPITSDTPVQPAQKTKIQPYTFEEVRSYLTERSREGFTDEVKDLVTKYGSGKLSSVNPASYPVLMLEAQFRCREPLTKVDIVKRVDELISEGYKDQISEIFTRSFATSADDLLEENYAAFMIDSWGLDHE